MKMLSKTSLKIRHRRNQYRNARQKFIVQKWCPKHRMKSLRKNTVSTCSIKHILSEKAARNIAKVCYPKNESSRNARQRKSLKDRKKNHYRKRKVSKGSSKNYHTKMMSETPFHVSQPNKTHPNALPKGRAQKRSSKLSAEKHLEADLSLELLAKKIQNKSSHTHHSIIYSRYESLEDESI